MHSDNVNDWIIPSVDFSQCGLARHKVLQLSRNAELVSTSRPVRCSYSFCEPYNLVEHLRLYRPSCIVALESRALRDFEAWDSTSYYTISNQKAAANKAETQHSAPSCSTQRNYILDSREAQYVSTQLRRGKFIGHKIAILDVTFVFLLKLRKDAVTMGPRPLSACL